MSVVDEIKARLDVVEIISETVKLRKTGKNYSGFCPFHPNSRTPAFAVFPESGTWKCYGACNEGGDLFRFVMKRDGLSFTEALRVLAERAGVELKPRTPQDVQADESHDRLRALLELAVTYYRHLLLNAPQAQAARDHLHTRGLSATAIETFQIGYALPGWDAGLNYFKSKGHGDQDLIDAGLVTQRDDGGVYDRFRNRIMIPIRDMSGRMAGFGARVLDPKDLPKFLNSPQTALFDKGGTLYALDRAKKSIREQDQAVIVEGYMDVVAAHQAGFTNVVSPMGTALTETQLRLLKKFTRRIVLALDADAAGDQATLRGLDIARQSLDREADPVFDPRGLVRYEGRLSADIRVLTLPPGLDPDEVLSRDPEQWRTLVAGAEPVVEYVIRVLTTGRNLDDPKVKVEIADRVLPLIADVASAVERDTYRQKLARVLKVNERALETRRTARPAAARRSPARLPSENDTAAAGAQEQRPSPPANPKDAYCLGMLLRMPELLYKVDRQLGESQLDRLSGEDFADTELREIFETLRKSLEQDKLGTMEFVRERLDPSLAFRLEQMDELTGRTDLGDPKSAVDALKQLLHLRERRMRRWSQELDFLFQDSQARGDHETVQRYTEMVTAHSAALGRLQLAIHSLGRRAESSGAVGMSSG